MGVQMPFILPFAYAALTAFLACSGCDRRDEEIQIGPEPLPRPKQPELSRDKMDLNNPLFRQDKVPFTEANKSRFLQPLGKESFQQDLSPQEQMSFRKLSYQTQRMKFFSQVYSFGRQLEKNDKIDKANEVFRQLLDEKFPVPLEIRDLARRNLHRL